MASLEKLVGDVCKKTRLSLEELMKVGGSAVKVEGLVKKDEREVKRPKRSNKVVILG